MNAIRARLAALVASFLIARLATWGLVEATPELAAQVEEWLIHTFEVFLLAGYAIVHPWLQKRLNPTGAMTGEAARRLERLAHVKEGGG